MAEPDRTLRGIVRRVETRGVYVEVPKLGQGVQYLAQPSAPVVETGTQPAGSHAHSFTTDTSSGTTSTTTAHTHAARPLQAGDAVLVTTVNGVKDDLVVLCRLL